MSGPASDPTVSFRTRRRSQRRYRGCPRVDHRFCGFRRAGQSQPAVPDRARGQPDPARVAFQPRLTCRGTRLAHRIEHARLTAIQRALNRHDGTIAYLNTSAFAVRRDYAHQTEPFFCPGVSRGEDTLVLARLAREGQLPCFLAAATADHRPPGPTIRYLARHLRIGRHTHQARNQLAARPGVLLSWPDRWRTLCYLRQSAGAGAAGSLVTALAVAAYTLEVCGRAVGHMPLRRAWHVVDQQR